MRRLVIFVLPAALLAGCVLLANSSREEKNIDARVDLLLPLVDDMDSYARADSPYTWEFPADHGAHPDFQTEWWYYTGNLTDSAGRQFGYQFTVFRRAAVPKNPDSRSEWRSNQFYMAHFTISDIETEQFFHYQRFSRGAADLAGATVVPRYHVWLDDWGVTALDEQGKIVQLRASEGPVTIDLTLQQSKPPVLHGDNGLSAKSSTPGNASYYYSLTRLMTEGSLTLGDNNFTVSGSSWMDHEFSTSALGSGAQGWDWFGLHLDDNRELMIGQIRLSNGDRELAFGGLLIEPDGSTRFLPATAFKITPTRTWTSVRTGTTYPAGWTITIGLDEFGPLELRITPLMADQELVEGAIVYWEGAVRVDGDVTGTGYAELTGYHAAMQGRF